MEYLQLKLVSDGTREGTFLVDNVSGNRADNVINYRLEMDASNHLVVSVSFIAMPVEINTIDPKIVNSLVDLFDSENHDVNATSPGEAPEYVSGV